MIKRTNSNFLINWKKQIDTPLFISFCIILICGMLMAFSAYPYTSAGYKLIIKYIAYSSISLLILFIISKMKKNNLIKLSYVLFFIFFILLILVPFIGFQIKGASRWIHFPLFSLQPSELLKPFFCIVSAIIIIQIKKIYQNLKDTKLQALKNININFTNKIKQIKIKLWTYISLSIITLGIIIFSIYRQPDMGMLMSFFVVLGIQIFVAKLNMKIVMLFMIIALTFPVIGYYSLPHFKTRIDNFFFSELKSNEQQGIALHVIETSSLTGGVNNGKLLKQYVPDVHTDFVFTAFCESFGGIAGLLLISVLFYFVIRIFKLLRNYDDEFIIIACSGIAGFIAFQIMINLMSNLALFPPKGMTLPFISYGGSSYLASAISVGVLFALLRIDLPSEIKM